MSPYVRTVRTASGARAVQIVHSSRRGSRDIEHIGSAHDDVELELLRAWPARRRSRPGDADRAAVTFTSHASFGGVTFARGALFDGATFGGAWFEEATFISHAGFHEATFTGGAGFEKATFPDAIVLVDGVKVTCLDDPLLHRSWPPGWTVRPDPVDPSRGTLVQAVADPPSPHDSD